MPLVWISTARGHASNLRPLRHDLAEEGDRGADWFDVTKDRIRYGEPVTEDKLPRVIFGAPDARESAYRLPDLFHAYGFWVVSAAAAAVLGSAELGETVLAPVQVLKKDRVTPVEGKWCCLAVGNQKSALLPEHSPRMHRGYIRDGQKGWFPPFVTGDDDVAVSSSALTGSDIWIDPEVGDAVFLSARLRDGLNKAKADRGWFLSKCRVMEVGAGDPPS